MKNVAIIGTGRMGFALAGAMRRVASITMVSRGSINGANKARQLCVSYTSDYKNVSQSDVIIICVPAAAVSSVIEKVTLFAKQGAIVVNSATKAFINEDIKKSQSQLTFAEAKIIGHAGSIEKGIEAYSVIDAAERAHVILGKLYKQIGFVSFGETKDVPSLSSLATGAGIRAAMALEKKLRANQLPRELVEVLVKNVGAGTMRAYIENDLGHFGKELVNSIEQDLSGGDDQ